MDRTFLGASKRLDDIDLPKLGHMIGVGEDEIHAFLDVETRGNGFDDKGRPIILFEPHVFWRNLPAAKRKAAQAAGLAYPKWGARPYPKDSYPRLKLACDIDETAALKSTSWGLGQVLGENFASCGYKTVQDFVTAMMADEELQLKASVDFIKANKLDDDLRRHDWAGFARGYNGPGYAKNGYDLKMADAFRKWSRIKDTAWTPGAISDVPEVPKPIPPAPVAPPAPVEPVPVEDATINIRTVVAGATVKTPWWKGWF